MTVTPTILVSAAAAAATAATTSAATSSATTTTTSSTRSVFFLLLLLLLSHISCTTGAASSSSSSYTAVTALDKYGNSVQLQHAREAAMQHGTPMIAAMATDGIVVVSLQSKARLGIIRSESQLIHALSLHNNNNNNNNNNNKMTMGIVCTGVKADAKWLIRTLRDYQKRNWETYDLTNLSTKRCQEAMAQILLLFMGYNRDREFHDIAVVPNDNNNDDGSASSSSWSRPMGVQSLLLSYSNRKNSKSTITSSFSSIALVDPSGAVVQELTAQAIGRNSADIHAKLEESNYDPNSMALIDVQELLLSIARDVFDPPSTEEFVVELLTPDGIQRVCSDQS